MNGLISLRHLISQESNENPGMGGMGQTITKIETSY